MGEADPQTEADSAETPSLAKNERMPVGVIVERRPAHNRWEDHVWRAVAVVPGAPPTEAWSVVVKDGAVERYFAGVFELELHPRETSSYLLNLATDEPSVYIVRIPYGGEGPSGVGVKTATVSPAEAEGYIGGGDYLVDRVAMPLAIAAWLADYCKAFHVEEKFWKRKRKRHDPRKGFGRGSGHNDYGPSSAEEN